VVLAGTSASRRDQPMEFIESRKAVDAIVEWGAVANGRCQAGDQTVDTARSREAAVVRWTARWRAVITEPQRRRLRTTKVSKDYRPD
jgi:hypothetical protein